MKFDYLKFLPEDLYSKINYIKTFKAEIIAEEANKRAKPAWDRQNIVFAAADHNARMINEYNGNKIGLSNRHEYLSRLVRMLFSKEVDGVEAAPDIIEDLLALNYLTKQKSGIDFMENKIIVGTVNRGGLKNTSWEMDDMCTCFTVERIAELNLDGVKFMLRINPEDHLSKNTLRYCAQTVNDAQKYDLPVFIETLFVRKKDNGFSIETDTESLVKAVGVVSALGCTSLRKWLEVPVNKEYKTVAGATASSVLAVPDEIESEPLCVIKEYTAQIGLSSNVRGILLGRNIMYNDSDPYLIAEAVCSVWHKSLTCEAAYEAAKKTSRAEEKL